MTTTKESKENNEKKARQKKIIELLKRAQEEKKSVTSPLTVEESALFRTFFTPELVELISKRYALNTKTPLNDIPKDIQELAVLLVGLSANLNAKGLVSIGNNFNNKRELMGFLNDNVWNVALSHAHNTAKTFSIKLLQSLEPHNKALQDQVKRAMDIDFIQDASRINANYYAIILNPFIKNGIANEVAMTATETTKPTGSEVARVTGGLDLTEQVQKSLQSEFVAKVLGFSKLYSNPDKGLIIPLPNADGEMEAYQVMDTYDAKGLRYKILAAVPPFSSSNSPALLVVFGGTESATDLAAIRRNTDTTGFLALTPGKHVIKEQAVSILEKVNQWVKKLDETYGRHKPERYTMMVCGHSLGAADAQHLVIDTVHVNAIAALKNKNAEGLKKALDLIPEVDVHLKDIQTRMKGREPQLTEIPRLKIDLQAWGAPGIDPGANKSTMIILDKLNTARDVNIQFSHVAGDPIKSVGVHLGSLDSQKSVAGLAADFRPRGDSFKRHKVIWDNVPLENTHADSVFAELRFHKNASKQKGAAAYKKVKATAVVRNYRNSFKPAVKSQTETSVTKRGEEISSTKRPSLATTPKTLLHSFNQSTAVKPDSIKPRGTPTPKAW